MDFYLVDIVVIIGRDGGVVVVGGEAVSNIVAVVFSLPSCPTLPPFAITCGNINSLRSNPMKNHLHQNQ